MRRSLTLKLSALALVALIATPALAQQGGVKVGGNLTNTTLVGQNTNAAIGLGTEACSEIGVIGSESEAC